MATDYTREQLLAAEDGTIHKDPGGKLRIALVYPNSYAVGMSNLGFQTLYRLLNARPDVVCERAFLSGQTGGVRTLESGRPLGEMDVVAFSVSFELDYPHIPRLLRLAGLEPFAAHRERPLVLVGGATVCYNPEPIAPFADIMVVGEAEELLDPLVEALQATRATGNLDPLAALPGVYLPARGPVPVARLLVRALDTAPTSTQIFTPHTEFGDMALVEVGRGCPYGCRFCVASHVYRPARWRSLPALLPVVTRGLGHRHRIGLIGASVTDHPAILPLCEEILRQGGEPAPASMRADALTDELLALLVRGHVRTITLAPEAGTETLRRQVGKRLTDDVLLAAAVRAARAGITRLKMYCIVGLPGETEDDVAAIPALALHVAAESGLRVSVGCSAFVPKPGTPFAREPQAPEREIRRKLDLIRRGMRGRIELTHESARWSYWQAVLARGDQALAPVLAAIATGPDTPAAWATACRDAGVDPDGYALRAIPPDAPLPWAHIGASRGTFAEVTDATVCG